MHTLVSASRTRFWMVVLTGLLCLGYFRTAAALGPLQDSPPLPSPEATPISLEGAPVVVNGRELFRLQNRIGSITATERAALVSEHISRLANNPFVTAVEIIVVDVEDITDIVAGEEVLVTVTEADAQAAGRERQELARVWASAIQASIEEGQAGRQAEVVITGLGVTVGVLLVLFLLIWLINRSGDWLADKLDPTTESRRLPRWLARSEVYQSGAFSRFVRLLMRWIKVLLVVFLVVVAIPLILGAFPRTQQLGNQLGQLLLGPLARLWDGFIGFLPDLVFLLVLSGLTWVAIRLVRLFFREVERGVIRLPSFEPEWAGFTARMIIFLLIIVAAIIGFTSLPLSQLPIFQGVSAFIALLLTLASTSAIANIIAGIILTYTGAFRLGDIVQLQTTTGEVVGKYLLTTRIRTFKNELVSFPNSLVLSNSITNYSRMARENKLIVYTTITLGYDAAWQTVHELLIAAALDCDRILRTPPPFVLHTSLNDYHVSYELNASTSKPELLPRIYSDLHKNIQERFNAAGVEIMSPAYTALRDGNTITLPPDFRPDDYQPPAFRARVSSEGQR